MATKNHSDQTSAATLLLYQHEDGRNLVTAPSSEAVTGDPGWHRVGPVEVEHLQPPGVAAATVILDQIASLSNAVRDLMQRDTGGTEQSIVVIEAIASQIGWLADLGAGHLGDRIPVRGDARDWMLPECYAAAEGDHV